MAHLMKQVDDRKRLVGGQANGGGGDDGEERQKLATSRVVFRVQRAMRVRELYARGRVGDARGGGGLFVGFSQEEDMW